MLSELGVMKSLQPHPHVVRLIGCCIEKGTFMLISVCCMFFFLLMQAFLLVIFLSKVRVLLRLKKYCLNYCLPEDE